MSGYYGGIFSAYKDTKIMGITTIIGAIINLLVNILLINYIGIYAAALSTLVSCMVIFYYRKYKVKQYVNLKSSKDTLGYIILFITTILYYANTNVIIKILNLAIVCAYAIFNNKEIILRISQPVFKKIKKQ